MNWGKGILIAMISFIGFIVTLVVILMSQKVDLVSEDYYLQELDYNKSMNAQTNYVESADEIKVEVSEDSLFLVFPKNLQNKDIKMELKHKEKAQYDLKMDFKSNEKNTFVISKEKFGKYDCKLNWTKENKEYELQKTIEI
jgi:hypothetical protein